MRRLLLPFALLLPFSAALVVACSASLESDALSAKRAGEEEGTVFEPLPEGGYSIGNGPPNATADAALGNPLCGAAFDRCNPDSDGTRVTSYGETCATPPPDAGAVAPGADASTMANGCRVEASETSDEVAPRCHPGGADRRGTDGVRCESGGDCAPGFDCVGSERVCRRYCCAGSCSDHKGQNGGPTFCDIQPLHGARTRSNTPVSVPVCMPFKRCTLLVENGCGASETCAVVNEKGDTGCVPRGERKEGESCDDQNCMVDLTCLGSAGSRRCYRLCRTDGNDCTSTQTCKTSTVFQEPAFGICK